MGGKLGNGKLFAAIALAWALVAGVPLFAEAEGDASRDTAENLWATVDRYLLGDATGEELARLRDVCKNKKESFCPLLGREKKLARYRRRYKVKTNPVVPPAVRPEPVIPMFEGSHIKNAKSVRKAKVQALLAGMQTTSPETLRAFAAITLKDHRCPDPLAAATAATLESFLADASLYPLIARLYEKAGSCAGRRSADREHFYTRAGLLQFVAKDYARAAALFDKAPVRDALTGRALFWHRRALLALGKEKAAEKVGRELKRRVPFSFHAILLRTLEGEPVVPPAAAEEKEAAPWLSPLARAVVDCGENLTRQGYTRSGDLLARWALSEFRLPKAAQRHVLKNALPTSQVLYGGGMLLSSRGSQPRALWELAYPKAYWELVAAQTSVDPFFLLAVARKESLLDPDAVSRTQATGLLQIQPQTAERLRRGFGNSLKDPGINAQMAAVYFTELFARFQNQIPLAVAAYNAGEEAVERWTNRYPLDDMLLFLDLIPYRETRDYVASVLSNYSWYRALYQDGPPVLAGLVTKAVARSATGRIPKSVDGTDDGAKIDPDYEAGPPPLAESEVANR